MLDQADLMELLSYDPQRGAFVWRVSHGRGRAGTPAESSRGRGMLGVTVHGLKYFAHHVAWVFVHGVLPPDGLIHRNMIRSDNSIENLIPAIYGERVILAVAEGRGPRIRGVVWNKHRKNWRARIQRDKEKIHIGNYDSADEAYAACLVEHARLDIRQDEFLASMHERVAAMGKLPI